MGRILVKELRSGDVVDQIFIIRDCQFNTTKAGQPFAKVTLGDATGNIAAIYWDVPEPARAALSPGKFAQVRGTVNTYNNSAQVTLQQVQPASTDGLEMGDFLPTTDKDIPAMFKRLKAIMATVENPFLVEFVRATFTDKEFCDRFKRAPAASAMHHACIGGLLEHTLSMAESALNICGHYKEINRELLLVGVLIHDIGKVEEFHYDTCIEYSDTGRLVGHIGMGLIFVERKTQGIPGFPPRLLDVLRHFILSHHGVPEFGAIRSPMTAEAIALHYIDNLDAKMSAFFKAATEHPVADDKWTGFQKMFDGYLYRADMSGILGASTFEANGQAKQPGPGPSPGPDAEPSKGLF